MSSVVCGALATLLVAIVTPASAKLVINSDSTGTFTGTGTMRIELEQPESEGWEVHRIECTTMQVKGKVSSPLDARAALTSWTVDGCTAYRGTQSFGTAYVTVLEMPEAEAVSTTKVKLLSPASGRFKLFISYQVGGGRCTDEVEMGTVTYNYTNGSVTNQLNVNVREFFGPAEFLVLQDCLDGGYATFEPKVNFPNPQFEVYDDGLPASGTGSGAPTVTTGEALTSDTSAELQGQVEPHGKTGEWYFEYGLTKDYGTQVPVPHQALSSQAVTNIAWDVKSLKPSTTYHYRLVASTSAGKGAGYDKSFTTDPAPWEVTATQSPSNATQSILSSVDCEPESTKMCMAVGKATVTGTDKPLAEVWDGHQWSLMMPPMPPESSGAWLKGVTCPAAAACMAVGYQKLATGLRPLVEVWNGIAWTILPSPSPAGASETVLNGVSCLAGLTYCAATGFARIEGQQRAVALQWNGSTWATSVKSASQFVSEYKSVSCRSTIECVAVGQYYSTNIYFGNHTNSLLDTWNGIAWWMQSIPKPPGSPDSILTDVTCPTGTATCVAAGIAYYPSWDTRIVRYTGSEWVTQASLTPSGYGTIYGVSCSNEYFNRCAGVGTRPDGTLAVTWNGWIWSLQKTADIPKATGEILADVSCRVATCVAVGSSTDSSSGVTTTLGEIYDASARPSISVNGVSSATSISAKVGVEIDPNGLPTQYLIEYGLTDNYGSQAPVPSGSLSEHLLTAQSVSQSLSGLQPGTTYHFRVVASNSKGVTSTEDRTLQTPTWEMQPTPKADGRSILIDVSCEPSTSVCTAVGESTVSGADSPVAQRWNGTSWSEQSAAKKSGTL
ncbi:MAG TPA: fibronectin type III domain-containing protein, partial [Solirubrobacterales bacterium]|nr:fibronectin type III domain-containing protein [Solirubrobacterales bacterium]